MKKLFTLLVFLMSFAFASNVHLDPKITNAINPTSPYVLWYQSMGSQNENLYPSNTEVKINSTAFDNYARFSFYRSNDVTSIEPTLFNNFATSNKIPYTLVWDSLTGDMKRPTFYSVGDLAFMQSAINYSCPKVAFFTTSDRNYSPKNSRFENTYTSWIGTTYGDRMPVKLSNNNSTKIICTNKSNGNPTLFNVVPSSVVDGYIYPMTFNKVLEYKLQDPTPDNLEYVVMWSWNHVNGDTGEKRFFDNGRFDIPSVSGIRINDANVVSTSTTPEVLEAKAIPKDESTYNKTVSLTSEYTNETNDPIDYNSPSFSQAVAKTVSVAHASAYKTAYSAKAKVKIPFLGDVENTITLDYTGTTTTTDTTAETNTVTMNSQKVKVNPGCSIQIEQVLNSSKENGLLSISNKITGSVKSNGVLWKTDGSQQRVSGSYNLYELLAANNPKPAESWITLDNANKTVVLHDMATYVATKDNFVQTKIHMTCKGKTEVIEEAPVPAKY